MTESIANPTSETSSFVANKKWSFAILVFTILLFSGYALRGIVPFNFEVVLVFILIALSVLFVRQKHLSYDSNLLVFTGLILLYFSIVSLALHTFHDMGPITEHKLAILFLFPAFLLLSWLIYQIKPSLDYFWYFIFFASLVMLLWGFLELWQVGLEEIKNGFRLGDYYSNPIKFGVYVNALFILMLGGLVWAYKKSKLVFILWGLLLIANLMMVIMSQTRTAWIGWPEALIGWGAYYLFLLTKSEFAKPVKVIILMTPFLVVLAVVLSPLSNLFSDRINLAVHDVEVYIDASNYNTSLGKRFIMYETAVEMIVDKPLTGHGADGFKEAFTAKSKAVLLARFGIEFDGFKFSHVHNQFLMTAVQYGVFAALSLIFIFFYLFTFFIRGIRKACNDEKPIFIGGLVFTVATFLAFMPESPLEFSGYSAHYLLFFSLLFGFANSHMTIVQSTQNKIIEKKKTQ